MGKFNSQDLTLLRAGTGRLAKLLDIDLADVTLVPDGSACSTVETDRYQIGLGMETTTCYQIGLGMETTTYYLSDEERNQEAFIISWPWCFQPLCKGVYVRYCRSLC
ncbi:hypothetical protein [Prevotellamassilia timonensis]|uniref:hypothetical protein n=1 Tax=Prevotellamassilia timonensis TaxID=1852370 RepID=UPI003080CFE1